jgi:hypothetical protein
MNFRNVLRFRGENQVSLGELVKKTAVSGGTSELWIYAIIS